MVKNKIGGNKSKNIGSKFTKKKISVEEPDFENSFFACVIQKPNGLMCKIKIIINNDNVKKLVEQHNLEGDVQVNIGKLKHDKRNNSLASGDIVQVEFTFEMNRQNGGKYGTILCRYDSSELKEFKRNGVLKLDDIEEEELDLPSSESEKSKGSLKDEDIDLDDL